MNTSSLRLRHRSQINHKIPDLAKEVVLISIPVDTSVGVRVRVNNSNTLKASSGFDSRKCNRITNELSVVVLYDWRADDISPWREID